jgi:hypothetical protein
VAHPGIVPRKTAGGTTEAEYAIDTASVQCDLASEASYSNKKQLLQSRWGDHSGAFDPSGPYYVAQDGDTSIAIDVTANLNKFRNVPGAPLKARVNLEPCPVDKKINITDITRNLDGFRGIAYPYSPSVCGCSNPADPCTCPPVLAAEEVAAGVGEK